MTIWRWDLLRDRPDPQHRLSLGEGDTPLVQSRHVGPSLGLARLFFKLESCNPTGSYKDRFAAAALSHMLSDGSGRCLATTSGNTGASLAAYCAAAGIPCDIYVHRAAPLEKLRQMQAYGARLYSAVGYGMDPLVQSKVIAHIRQRAAAERATLQVSAFAVSPKGMSGVRTISYELSAQLSHDIDDIFVPCGGGGLALAIARGFEDLAADGQRRAGRIHCVQPVGNDTVATPLRAGERRARTVRVTSGISGLQVPTPPDGDEALSALRRSGGTGHVVTDEAIWAAQRRLAREEGIYCEPAGATALAGVITAARSGELLPTGTVVSIVSGTGFKDRASTERLAGSASVKEIEIS